MQRFKVVLGFISFLFLFFLNSSFAVESNKVLSPRSMSFNSKGDLLVVARNEDKTGDVIYKFSLESGVWHRQVFAGKKIMALFQM